MKWCHCEIGSCHPSGGQARAALEWGWGIFRYNRWPDNGDWALSFRGLSSFSDYFRGMNSIIWFLFLERAKPFGLDHNMRAWGWYCRAQVETKALGPSCLHFLLLLVSTYVDDWLTCWSPSLIGRSTQFFYSFSSPSSLLPFEGWLVRAFYLDPKQCGDCQNRHIIHIFDLVVGRQSAPSKSTRSYFLLFRIQGNWLVEDSKGGMMEVPHRTTISSGDDNDIINRYSEEEAEEEASICIAFPSLA